MKQELLQAKTADGKIRNRIKQACLSTLLAS
jgi:hypothetical protein